MNCHSQDTSLVEKHTETSPDMSVDAYEQTLQRRVLVDIIRQKNEKSATVHVIERPSYQSLIYGKSDIRDLLLCCDDAC